MSVFFLNNESYKLCEMNFFWQLVLVMFTLHLMFMAQSKQWP